MYLVLNLHLPLLLLFLLPPVVVVVVGCGGSRSIDSLGAGLCSKPAYQVAIRRAKVVRRAAWCAAMPRCRDASSLG